MNTEITNKLGYTFAGKKLEGCEAVFYSFEMAGNTSFKITHLDSYDKNHPSYSEDLVRVSFRLENGNRVSFKVSKKSSAYQNLAQEVLDMRLEMESD